MVRLASTLSKLNKCKILVVGDLMLDTYTIGKARRISPEAPVAIVQVIREENRAGGAGNVALNLLSLGAEVNVLSRIGVDSAGQALRDVLVGEGIGVSGIFNQMGYFTPIKNRVIADNQQIVRVDHELVAHLPELLEQQVIEALPGLLSGVSAVAVSDYGKGFLTKTLLSALFEAAKKLGIPVITDPKGVDFAKYSGTTIIKPNLSEAYAAAGLLPDAPLDNVADKILALCDAEMLMVTRSEAGISIFQRGGERLDFPVRVKEIKDVTGAGDTVLAMLACATANGLGISEAAQLSNVAAGIAIERFGCARISLADLAHRLLESDVTNKVFDEEHLYALQTVLQGKSYTILGVSGAEGMTSSIFRAIQGLRSEPLVIYITDDEPDNDFVDLLASVQDVQFIIVHHESLKLLCSAVEPKQVLFVDRSELRQLSCYRALVS